MIANSSEESSPFNCDALASAEVQATPAPSKRGKVRKPPAMPADAMCPTCSRELAVFYQSRAWCIHCEQMELFGDINAHRERAAAITNGVAR